MNDLERVTPEEVGIDSETILKFIKSVNETGYSINSFMILRYGKIVAEAYWKPFSAELKHNLHSCSKSFTATAVGIAVGEKRFSLDDKIIDLLPEKLDNPPHKYIAAMKVKHLLKMATAFSVFVDPITDDWTKEFLNSKPDHYPGTLFGYDTSGTHTLCEIIQKFTGMTMEEYLKPRLLDPIGINDIEFEVSPMGINRGGGGVRITTESMARFGQLYLQDGVWNDKRILPEGWVKLATKRHIDDSNVTGITGGYNGYGYNFWCLKENAFSCLGLGGQVITVIPKKDMVFVMTSNGIRQSNDYYIPHELMWNIIYPAVSDKSMPANKAKYKQLQNHISNLETFLPRGEISNPFSEVINNKRFDVEENLVGYDGFKISINEKEGTLSLFNKKNEDIVRFGMGTHILDNNPFQKYASEKQYWGQFTFINDKNPRKRSRCGNAAIWTDERTLIIHSHLIDIVQSFVITCNFGEEANIVQIFPFGVFSYDSLPCTITNII